MRKPVIAINANLTNDKKYNRLATDYTRAILKAGGILFIIPPFSNHSEKLLEHILEKADGLLLSGGNDISPEVYGENHFPHKIKEIPKIKQRFDIELTRLALKKNLPVLAICYGHQLLNVVLGGSLFQDINTQIKGAQRHKRSEHTVYLCEGTLLVDIIRKKTIRVNSTHHQCIKTLGKGLMINALAQDGIIEGVEIFPPRKNAFCIGVQWHPERILHKKEQLRLFQEFIRISSLNRIRKE
ncbi:MAG: gamma-glutamyl-gamma-aminobutyrate hydrolase family protein [Planctomycetota bacterium]|nr:gamma-glutamyl-gamma-aminobutyrate hydrolase family protein [Planctomycetota bacterium]MDI6786938.1 gamma-glutamyl-gamma-aminobutyrate hydrolase family protein [Planctomycetota bacterium]